MIRKDREQTCNKRSALRGDLTDGGSDTARRGGSERRPFVSADGFLLLDNDTDSALFCADSAFL